MSLHESLRALEKKWRDASSKVWNMQDGNSTEVDRANQLDECADELATLLSDRQEVAPVAWLVEAESYRNVFLCRKHAGAELDELRLAGYEASITPLGNPYVGEAVRNDPSWPLFDRVDFALRDAGFDFDQAAEIAALAAGQTSDAREANSARYEWLRSALYRGCVAVGEARIELDVTGACPSLADFDTAIDAAMEASR